MNDYDQQDENDRHGGQEPRQPQAPDPGHTVTASEAPVAGEASALAHHRDPSLASGDPKGVQADGGPDPAKERGGVAWVRATDLLAAQAANWAARGIDLGADLNRRARSGIVATARKAGGRLGATGQRRGGQGREDQGRTRQGRKGGRPKSERARRLPPVWKFGQRTGGTFQPTAVTRAGIRRTGAGRTR